MDKEQILAQSRKENQYQDERDHQIQLKAYFNAHTAVIAACVILYCVAAWQKRQTGAPFADPMLFLFLVFVGDAFRYATQFYYNRKKYDLVMAAVCAVPSLTALAALAGQALGLWGR